MILITYPITLMITSQALVQIWLLFFSKSRKISVPTRQNHVSMFISPICSDDVIREIDDVIRDNKRQGVPLLPGPEFLGGSKF